MAVDDLTLSHLREQCEFNANAISDDRRVEWWQLVDALTELELRRQKDQREASGGR